MRHIPARVAMAALAIAIGTAAAQAAGDCPPVGHLPNYVVNDDSTVIHDYDAADFTVKDGDDTKTVTVMGRDCKLTYNIKDGVQPLSNLEIQTNYRQQLTQAGAAILFTDDGTTVARLDKAGPATWMRISSSEASIDVEVVLVQPLQQVLTRPTGNDYRLIGHMPGYLADPAEKRNFDKLSFTVQDGDDTRDVEVQGARISLAYHAKDGLRTPSNLAIQENYRTALAALGAQILFRDPGTTTARLDDNGQAVWIRINSSEATIEINVIEEKAFRASIEPPQANAMKAALDRDGHIALYVNFDFAKAVLRPDAAPVIAQVVSLMKGSPDLKLSVEGHTDNVGSHDFNLKLSQGRAEAMVEALVRRGIAADRLAAVGHGADQPIADNNTDEGRARNRRVELVKQ
jgi:outer membrane protein OmpA-like peptidoglycan-associated protein